LSGRPSRSGQEFRLSGCATPLVAADVPAGAETIAQPVTVTLRTPPTTVVTILIDAPRGAILARQLFTVRFLTREGARRALFQSAAVTALAGMRDHIEARMLSEPGPAPERAAYREPIGLRFSGRIARAGKLSEGTPVSVEIVNASASGLCIATASSLTPGDGIEVNGPQSAAVGAALVEVVRRDFAAPTRFGARFSEEEPGKGMFEALVGEARAARAAARARVAPETPKSPADVLEELRSRGMATRRGTNGKPRFDDS
jgi:hypothetical protein